MEAGGTKFMRAISQKLKFAYSRRALWLSILNWPSTRWPGDHPDYVIIDGQRVQNLGYAHVTATRVHFILE